MRRIAIDGFNLALSKGSGIATYARNLNTGLKALGFKTHILYGPAGPVGRNPLLNEVALDDAQNDPPAAAWVRYLSTSLWRGTRRAVRVPSSGLVLPSPAAARATPDVKWAAQNVFHRANHAYAAWKLFTPVSFRATASEQPELMHWTCTLPMKAKGMANIYTIHDLVPLRLPFTTLDNKRRFHAMCRKICQTADHIVTVSESARRDIIDMFGVSEDRITNTYQAVSLPPRALAKSDDDVALEVESIFGLEWKNYYLFFGAIEPKKNLGRIIEAYLASGVSGPLVIVGGHGWLEEAETRMLYDDLVMVHILRDGVIRRSDRIRSYDYMPLDSLVTLIRGAKATLFPSLYEGFGLPVLESMLLGTPVLTSTGGSLPEVAGDASLMVDPQQVSEIKEGIRALDADEGLRAELITRGRAQAAKFDETAYRDRLEALYGRLL